jgi:hypothetical protein
VRAKLHALLRRYPYTSGLVIGVLIVPGWWAGNTLTHSCPSLLSQGFDCGLAFLFGCSWIARWSR